MRRNGHGRQFFAVMAVALLGSACGGGGDAASDARVPEIDFTDPIAVLIATDVAARADDREFMGLANLGPGSAELAAAMDAGGAALLAEFAADIAPASGFRRSPLSGAAGAPGPGSNSWSAYGMLVSSLHHLATNATDATLDHPPETTQAANGSTSTTNRTMTATSSVTGSQLSAEITIRLSARVTDANGNVVYSIESTATGKIEVDFCPDASGHTVAHVNLSSTETFTGTGGGGSTTREQSADVGITVGDDASIVSIEGTADGSDSRQGPPGADGSAAPVATRTSRSDIANDGNGRRLSGVDRDIQLGGENSTSDQQARLFGDTTIFMELMVSEAAKEAETLWKSGKCVELIIDPEGRNVQPDEVIQVTAKLRHKIEGNELDKGVEATLTGVKTVEPAGEKQPAPATVTFTAGPNEGDVGRINFKSVSNRGIVEKTATFTVAPAAWDVTFEGTHDEVFLTSRLVDNFEATANLHITAADGVLSGTGELHLVGTMHIVAGPLTCEAPLDQVSTVVVSGTLEGEGPEAVLLINLRATAPPGDQVTFTCTIGPQSLTQQFPSSGAGGRFGVPFKNFALPAVGGAVPVSLTTAAQGLESITITGTMTVTLSE